MEKRRTGSGQKQTHELNSSILRADPKKSKSHPSQKLQDDEPPKKLIPPLVLESVASENYQKKNGSNPRVSFFKYLIYINKKFYCLKVINCEFFYLFCDITIIQCYLDIF